MDGAGTIKSRFAGCTVDILHHDNKAGGIFGSVFYVALADFASHLEHKDGMVREHVEKMRDGAAHFDVLWGVQHFDGVPTVVPMNVGEAPRLDRPTAFEGSPSSDLKAQLATWGAVDVESALTFSEVAEKRLGPGATKAEVSRERDRLRN